MLYGKRESRGEGGGNSGGSMPHGYNLLRFLRPLCWVFSGCSDANACDSARLQAHVHS